MPRHGSRDTESRYDDGVTERKDAAEGHRDEALEGSAANEPGRADEDAHARADAHDDAEADPIFEALWGRVVEVWAEDKQHAAFLDYAIRAQKLPEAAARYAKQKADSARAELAQKKLEAITIAATQMLYATQMPKDVKPPRAWTWTAFAIMVVILAWVAIAVFGR
jgi:hypothetical protein